MKLKFTLTILLTGLALTSTGQNFAEQFKELSDKKDTLAQQKLLDEWKRAKPDDAELYVTFFNFYAEKSMKEVMRIEKTPPGNQEAFQIMNSDTTKKESEGYMFSETYYEPEILKTGYAYIDTAIAKYPSRLDMRFGKVYLLGETKEYENFTNEIIKTIDYSATIKNKWTWANNEPVKDDPKKFMLLSIQDYVLQLYNTMDDKLLDNMKRIAEAVLKYYPDHVESLSDLSIVYLLNKEYDKALEQLLKAEKLAPSDYIVLNNIAESYKRKGDNDNAVKYYEKVIKYANDEFKSDAKKKIEELKKK